MTSVPRSVSATPPSGRRFVSLAVVALLLAALMSALAPATPAAAQDSSTPTVDGGEVTLVVWRCPDGFDPATGSMADCTNATEGSTFTLTNAGASFTWTVGTLEPAVGAIQRLEPGTYTIQHEAAGGEAVSGRCAALGQPADAPLTDGGSLEVTVEPGAEYRCTWFLTGAAAATPVPDTGVVHVVSRMCPPGVEPIADAAALAEACQGQPLGRPDVMVSLNSMDGAWASGGATTVDRNSMAELEFDEVKTGQAVLRQEIPEGYAQAIVFCALGTPDSAEFGELDSWNEGTILDITPGAEITCAFFSFLPAGVATPVSGAGIVRLTVHACPADASRDAGAEDLLAACQEPAGEQVMVSVQHDFGGSGTMASIDDAGVQQAEIDEIPSGPIRVTLQMPDGYDVPVVFCSDAAGDATGKYQPVTLDDGTSFAWDFRADRVLDCLAFTFPAPDDPSIPDDSNQFTVTSYTCPVGTSITLGFDELRAACAPDGGMEVTLTHDGGAETQTTDAVTGAAVWAEVPEGSWTMQYTAPDFAFDDVFCGPSHLPQPTERVAIGGEVDGTLSVTGLHIVCSVFVTPFD